MRLLIIILLSSTLYSNEIIDSYLTNGINKQIVGDINDGIENPKDLDFNPVEGKENELWVLNAGMNGGSTVVIQNTSLPNQTSKKITDENAWHFMANPSSISLSLNETFGTSQFIRSANRNIVDFTGPTLWSSDLSIYAVAGNSPNDGLNGSHLDMLHGSPMGTGIENESGNTYWVVDGLNKQLTKYAFNSDHGPGHDDHSDGEVYRYIDFEILYEDGIPTHMTKDKNSNFLYICDTGNNRVIKFNTSSGEDSRDLSLVLEPLATHKEVTNSEWSEFITDLDTPTGAEIIGNYLIISEYYSGMIKVFDISNDEANFIGSISTGENSLCGITTDKEGNIYYVDNNSNKLVKLVPAEEYIDISSPSIHHTNEEISFIEFNVTNNSDKEVELDLSFNEYKVINTFYNVALLDDNLTLASGESDVISFFVEGSGNNIYSTIELIAQTEDSYFSKSVRIYNQLNKLLLNDIHSNQESVTSVIMGIDNEFVEISPEIFSELDYFQIYPNEIIINTGFSGAFESSQVSDLLNYAKNGTNILFFGYLIGDQDIFTSRVSDPEFYDIFGCKQNGLSSFGTSNSNGESLNLNNDNPNISNLNSMSSRILFNNNSPIRLTSLITSHDDAHPIYYKNESDLIAVSFDGPNYRSVISTVPYQYSSGNSYQTLINRTLNWFRSNPTSIHDATENYSFIVYPNPSTNEIRINFNEYEQSGQMDYEILDLTGRIIKSGEQTSNNRIWISDLIPGTYLIKVNGKYSKFIKE